METEKLDSKHIIVDVRTKDEWDNDGHADCAVNYPIDTFDEHLEELKEFDKVTVVCRSGGRAEIAKQKLLDSGYSNAIENLGSWKNINCKNK